MCLGLGMLGLGRCFIPTFQPIPKDHRALYIYIYNIDLQQAGSQNKILHSDFLILILADAVAISP